MKKRVFLDGKHTALLNVDKHKKTVVAEIESEDGIEFVYAEKFDAECNYEKEAIKACIRYIRDKAHKPEIKNAFINIFAAFVLLLIYEF